MPRWSPVETQEISIVRENCIDLIDDSPQYPEVVGDRKILRFLRGHSHDLEKATTMMRKFLLWRKNNDVNSIRDAIVDGGVDHPLKFPNGEKILSMIPQLIISPQAFDKHGAPICVDQYNFSPSEVLSKITIDEYIEFIKHCLEYRSLIVDQISEEREQAYLASLTEAERQTVMDPIGNGVEYGVLVNTCVIRDLGAVSFEHASSQGQEIIRAVVGLSSDNYPELMRKCFMINTPWVFNALWYFIKGLLAPRTLAKVSIMGSNFRAELEADIDQQFIPALVGGTYTGGMSYEPLVWDHKYLCCGACYHGDSSGSSSASSADEKISRTVFGAIGRSSGNVEGGVVTNEGTASSRVFVEASHSDSSHTVVEIGPRERSAPRLNRSGLHTEGERFKSPASTSRLCPLINSWVKSWTSRKVIRAASIAHASSPANGCSVEDQTPLALMGWL